MYLQEVARWFYHLAIVLLNSLIARDKQEQGCFTSGDKLGAEAQCKQCPRWAALSQEGSEHSRQSQLVTMTHWQSHTSQRDQSRLGSIQEDQQEMVAETRWHDKVGIQIQAPSGKEGWRPFKTAQTRIGSPGQQLNGAPGLMGRCWWDLSGWLRPVSALGALTKIRFL